MNKVIKKMWKKAEKYADMNAPLTDELEPMTIEHFAELIVRECITIAQDRAAFDWAPPNDVNHIIGEIKQHFGVK